jgi:predicted acyl esterase
MSFHEGQQKAPLRPIAGIVFEQNVSVQMHDGLHLMLNVFRPEQEGRFPVILSMSPYGKDNLPAQYGWNIMDAGTISTSDYAAFEAPDPGFWVPNGYIVIHGNVCGMWNSEGSGQWLSLQDAQDYYELIEWAAQQSWSNGQVGLCGVSYLAMSQWRVAALNPPHLKAIIPWEGASDMYREFVLQGGIRETRFFPGFFEGRVKASQNQHYPFGGDVVEMSHQHPLDDDYWATMRPDLAAITIPALICTSWSDHGMHTRGSLEGFKQITSTDKWLYTHGRKKWEVFYSSEAKEVQKQFFDYFLKDIENGMMEVPRIRLEVRKTYDQYTVRHEQNWPVARTQYDKWYLDAQQHTLVEQPVEQEGSITYSSELVETSRAGRASFDLRFSQDTELTGNMKLKLWVSAVESDDLDLFVGICKLDANGDEIGFSGYQGARNDLVTKGWLRVSHRELDEEKSTPIQPWLQHRRIQKVQPGEIVPVEIELWPSSTFFEAGSTLKLIVQGQELLNYRGFGHDELVNRGVHRISTGGPYDSYLLVSSVGA